MRSRAWMLAFPLLAGCATLATTPDTGRYQGLYAAGFEVDSFRPCGRDEQWWVTDAPALRERYRQLAGREYEPVFVVLRGEAGPPGRYGHLGAYRRELAVSEVLEIRPARPGECE